MENLTAVKPTVWFNGSPTIPLLHYCPRAAQGTIYIQAITMRIVGSKYICNASHPTVNCIIGLIQLHLVHFIQFVPPSPLHQVLEESETLYLRRRWWVWVWIGIGVYVAHCCQPFQMGEDTVRMPAVHFLTCMYKYISGWIYDTDKQLQEYINNTYLLVGRLREAPPKLASPLFGHCP